MKTKIAIILMLIFILSSQAAISSGIQDRYWSNTMKIFYDLIIDLEDLTFLIDNFEHQDNITYEDVYDKIIESKSKARDFSKQAIELYELSLDKDFHLNLVSMINGYELSLVLLIDGIEEGNFYKIEAAAFLMDSIGNMMMEL